MAYYFLFPESDTTIYSHPDRTSMNAGGDEILEIVKEKGTSNDRYYPSRVLIKFKNDDIKHVINNVIGATDFESGTTTCSIQLLSTEHKNLTEILNIEAFAVSQSWFEGTGRYSNLPSSSNGTSWEYRDNDITKTYWLTGSSKTVPVVNSFGSGSIQISQVPSSSAHQLTINGIDFIPVLSSSIFGNPNDTDVDEMYVEIPQSQSSAQLNAFGKNLETILNVSKSLTLLTASFTGSTNILTLEAIDSGSIGNVIITTSSIEGNNQNIFTSSFGFSTQGGKDTTTTVFSPGTSGSIKTNIGITEGGGVWYTGSEYQGTQQFLKGDNLDTNIDVTTIVQKFHQHLSVGASYPLGIANNGFIIKQPDIIEENTSSSFGEMQYFSVDTHTIFPPRLVFKWNDSIHNFQPNAKQNGELNVSLYKKNQEYNQNDEATFRIHVRDKYPVRQFASSSNFLNAGYFTTSSFYSIRDAHTEEEVIPFDDNCTKLSADSEGMYFKLYMKGLQPERYYRLLFKHTNNEGTTVYDNKYHFKLIR